MNGCRHGRHGRGRATFGAPASRRLSEDLDLAPDLPRATQAYKRFIDIWAQSWSGSGARRAAKAETRAAPEDNR